MLLQTLPHVIGETPEIAAAEAQRVWAEGSAQLVDVREQNEWDDAHIPDTTFIPLADLQSRATELDKSKPVVALCHAGVRSLAATEILLALGFAEVASLQGGILAWYQNGYQLER
jgi:rhodanese-related sulfurtransferase